MAFTKEQRLINAVSGTTKAQRNDKKEYSATGSFIIPNKSGDHYRSIKRDAPVNSYDLVNKEYVDDNYVELTGDSMTGNLSVEDSSNPSFIGKFIRNDDNDLRIVQIEQQGTGDASISFIFPSVAEWSVGMDNSDSDKFKISNAARLQTATALTIDTSEQVGIGNTAPSQLLEVGNNVFNVDAAGTASINTAINANFALDINFTTSITTGSAGMRALYYQDTAISATSGAFDAEVWDSHTTGSSTFLSGFFGGINLNSGGTTVQAYGMNPRAQCITGQTPTVTILAGGYFQADAEDATVTTTAAGIFAEPELDTGSSTNNFSVLSLGDIMQISNKKIYLEGSAVSTGDSYFVYDSGGGTIDCFVGGSEAWNASATGWQHTATNLGFYGTTPAAQSSAYTPSNVTTDRAYDADSTTVAELADVLGTLIADLQNIGLIG